MTKRQQTRRQQKATKRQLPNYGSFGKIWSCQNDPIKVAKMIQFWNKMENKKMVEDGGSGKI